MNPDRSPGNQNRLAADAYNAPTSGVSLQLTFANHKNQEIEVLRGIAILLVLFAHLGSIPFLGSPLYAYLPKYIQAGTGVDLFFCISGYVIALHFLRNSDRSWGNFYAVALPFWLRRFWRIIPSAWLWIAVTLILSVVFNRSGVFNNPVNVYKDALSVFLQVANFHFYECQNQINATVCGGNTIYWSLSLEEQFYMLFPFVIFLISRKFQVAFFAFVVLAQIFIPRSYAGIAWLIRTDAIALGVLIALMQEKSKVLSPVFLSSSVRRWAWLCVWCILIATIDAPGVHFVEFDMGLVALMCGILVWTASFSQGYIAPTGYLKTVLAYIGSRSYSLYLIHLVGNNIMLETSFRFVSDPNSKPLFAFITLPVIFLLAELNYRFLETPLRLKGALIAARFKNSAETQKI